MRNFLRFLLLGFAMMLPVSSSFAQVSISPDNTGPDPSAMLDVKSTALGVLIPRLTQAQMAAISEPAEGLMVFCTDCGSGSLSIFIAGGWNTVSITCISPEAPSGAEHIATRTQITWYWTPVPLATGYRWSAVSDFDAATETGTATTMTESGLIGGVSFTRYVWAYNACGESVAATLVQSTEPPIPPTVGSLPVTSVGLTTASSGGNVTDDGAAPVTERGVCWGTNPDPDISGDHTSDGTGTGLFSSTISGLSEGTVYYVRAYASNAAGTSYGSQLMFSTDVSDIDGNSYRTVYIGTQLWMAENLKTTKYSDGTAIGYHTTFRSISPEYAWYGNNTAIGDIYGALYNFPAVNTGKLCPTGWHVAGDSEWTILTTQAGGLSVAGGMLKETGTVHWQAPNTGATDAFGFTLLPAGATQQIDDGFLSLYTGTCIWTSNQGITRNASNDKAEMVRGTGYNVYVKNSVRCIKN